MPAIRSCDYEDESLVSQATRWCQNSFLPLLPPHPCNSHPFCFCICAGSTGVVMNLFAGENVAPLGIYGTDNVSWFWRLWNFLFLWPCFDSPPHSFPTLAELDSSENLEEKKMRTLVYGSFHISGSPSPEAKSHSTSVCIHDA